MTNSIQFILNNEDISTDANPAMLLLDFIREGQELKGTTTACREGDCAACAVLIGEVKGSNLEYRSITSCLYPLGNVQGLHVVTIEGLYNQRLNPIQEAIAEHGATQCGFCTPGFIVSLARFFLRSNTLSFTDAIESMSGNICRCTGYKSIERAASDLCGKFSSTLSTQPDRITALVKAGILPEYFNSIQERLGLLKRPEAPEKGALPDSTVLVGGGTDLYVQKPQRTQRSELDFVFRRKDLCGVKQKNGQFEIGAATTMEELADSPEIQKSFPTIRDYWKLIASTPIREQASIGGNLINASPIGDLTIFFLALNSRIELCGSGTSRTTELKEFYKGYKDIDKHPDEILSSIQFEGPGKNSYFNFEKVSKRTHLDIATVNSAMHCKIDDGVISKVTISAGGVGPVPMCLQKTTEFLKGEKVGPQSVKSAGEILQSEISPISDARGSANYKRLLLRQLFYAHFITCFPQQIKPEDLL